METDEKIREEFLNKAIRDKYFDDTNLHELDIIKIADYWLSLLHSRDTAIREAMERMTDGINYIWDGQDCSVCGFDAMDSDTNTHKCWVINQERQRIRNLLTEVLNKNK